MSNRAEPPRVGRARGRSGRGILLAAPVLGILLVLATAPAALGHVLLVSSDPADGSTRGTAPATVRLEFSEEVAVDLAKVQVFAGSGMPLPGITLVADPADAATLIVGLPSLDPGAYRLAWTVVDETDLHVTSGDVVFGIGEVAPVRAAAPAVATTDPAQAAARWLDLGLQVILAGSLVLLWLARLVRPVPRGARDDGAAVRRRLRCRLLRTIVGAGAGALLAGGLVFGLQVGEATAAATSPGEALAAALVTIHGLGWLLREAAIVVLIAMAYWLGRASAPGSTRRLTALATGLGVGVALGNAVGGHVGIGTPGEQPIRIVALAVHAAAAAAWVGGLGGLVLVAVPLLRRSPDRGVAIDLLRQFWRVALPAVAILALTGLYLAGQLVATPDALIGSQYGLILVAKVAAVGGVVGLGAWHSLALHPALRRRLGATTPRLRPLGSAPRHLGPTLVLEAAGGAAILLAAAALGSTPPARGPAFDPAPAAAVQPDVAGHAADLLVTLAIRPNRPGQDFVSVGVFDTRLPAPAPVSRISVALHSPTGQLIDATAAGPAPDGRYQLPVSLPESPGSWDVTVEVERVGLVPARLDTSWTVQGALPDEPPVIVSRAPLAGATTPAALVGLVALLGALASLGVRRRRASAPATSAGSIAAVGAVGLGSGPLGFATVDAAGAGPADGRAR
jgi:copper transport protein